MFAMIKV